MSRETSIENAFALARQLRLQGNSEQAAEIFLNIIKAAPAFEPARIELALLRLAQGAPEVSEDMVRPLLSNPDRNPYVPFLFCESLFWQGKIDEALTTIQGAIGDNPTNWMYHWMAGRLWVKKGQQQNAEFAYMKALDLNPDGTSVAIQLMQILTKRVALDEAIARLDALIQLRPQSIIYRYLHCSAVTQRAHLHNIGAPDFARAPASTPEIKALCALFSSAALFRSNEISAANAMIRQALDQLKTTPLDTSILLIQPTKDQVSKLRRYLDAKAVVRNDEDDFYQSDEYLTKVYWEYFQAFKANAPISNDSNITQHNYLRLARNVIAGQKIDAVANFGCFCAASEQVLSAEFPEVQFHGIDRAPLLKSLNDEHFKNANTSYYADDMLQWLENSPRVDNGMLVHMRTAVYCLPAFLDRLYSLAKQKGYRHVLLLENVGFDRNTLKYPQFDTGFESFMLRNWILVHDYPAILKRCGYDVAERTLVPMVNVNVNLIGAPNPDGSESLELGGWILPDMHLFCIHAASE